MGVKIISNLISSLFLILNIEISLIIAIILSFKLFFLWLRKILYYVANSIYFKSRYFVRYSFIPDSLHLFPKSYHQSLKIFFD